MPVPREKLTTTLVTEFSFFSSRSPLFFIDVDVDAEAERRERPTERPTPNPFDFIRVFVSVENRDQEERTLV